jgi:hypothetical protein
VRPPDAWEYERVRLRHQTGNAPSNFAAWTGLECDEAERPVGLVAEVAEEARKFVVLEIRSLLPLRPRSLRRRQFANRIRFGVSVEDGSLQAGSQYAEVFRPS